MTIHELSLSSSTDADVRFVQEVRRPAWPAVAPKQTTYVRVVKPWIDRLIAAVLLVVLAPLFALIAVVLASTLGRPIFFTQDRVGLGGTVFRVRKFRTMRPDRRAALIPYPDDRRQTHKSEADPRHTALGRFLRRTSLDELPQLVNVLKGEMSLVGPRPELTTIVATYDTWQHNRHAVRPGITGIWQVTARGDGPMEDFTHLDLAYVDQVSLGTDLRLLARTLPAALVRRGG